MKERPVFKNCSAKQQSLFSSIKKKTPQGQHLLQVVSEFS